MNVIEHIRGNAHPDDLLGVSAVLNVSDFRAEGGSPTEDSKFTQGHEAH